MVQESFQPQMEFLFPFLCANDLRLSLLIIRARSFYSLIRRGYIRKVSVQFVTKYFIAFAVLIVFHASNEKNGRKQD